MDDWWWEEYAGDPLTVTGQAQWITESDNWWGDYDEELEWQDFTYDLTPQYTYSSAINPEIMSALEGVFLSPAMQSADLGALQSSYVENLLYDYLGEQSYTHTASGGEQWTRSAAPQAFQDIQWSGNEELLSLLPLMATDIFDPESIASTLS